nr:hypothetical protein [Tanacetum cinerariifolium]GEV89627.1 hypothetical protein [Tanacetum cinerariifolium]
MRGKHQKDMLGYIFLPYLDAQEAKDIYKVIDRDYSLIPILARRDINNPDELCKTKEFIIMPYSIGTYITMGPTKINNVERTPAACLASTRTLQQKISRMEGTIRRILWFGIRRIDPYTDLPEIMIWYMLKKTCVELIRAF